jgi:hypothetical protein
LRHFADLSVADYVPAALQDARLRRAVCVTWCPWTPPFDSSCPGRIIHQTVNLTRFPFRWRFGIPEVLIGCLDARGGSRKQEEIAAAEKRIAHLPTAILPFLWLDFKRER